MNKALIPFALLALLMVGLLGVFNLSSSSKRGNVIAQHVEWTPDPNPSQVLPDNTRKAVPRGDAKTFPKHILFKEVEGKFYMVSQSLTILVEFEDVGLEREQRQLIVDDLQRISAHLKPEVERGGGLQILLFEGERFFPKVVSSSIAILGKTGEGYSMRVTREMSNAYSDALAFLDKHHIDVGEVAKRIVEIQLLGQNAEVNHYREGSIREFILPVGEPMLPDDSLLEAIKAFGIGQIIQPSLLAWHERDIHGRTEILAEALFLGYREGEVEYAQRIGLIRHEGKWKLAL